MKFVKYNDNKSVTIPPAVLTVCGLDDEGKLEMAGANGAVILSKSEMTAMEMVRTILALTNRAGQLMRELTDLCGSCEGCTEGHCTFRDADIEELIRPAVIVPDWARAEADISPVADEPLESSLIRIVAVLSYVAGVRLIYKTAILMVMKSDMTNQYHLLAHR